MPGASLQVREAVLRAAFPLPQPSPCLGPARIWREGRVGLIFLMQTGQSAVLASFPAPSSVSAFSRQTIVRPRIHSGISIPPQSSRGGQGVGHPSIPPSQPSPLPDISGEDQGKGNQFNTDGQSGPSYDLGLLKRAPVLTGFCLQSRIAQTRATFFSTR